MKKNYIKPEVECIDINTRNCVMMAGSTMNMDIKYDVDDLDDDYEIG